MLPFLAEFCLSANQVARKDPLRSQHISPKHRVVRYCTRIRSSRFRHGLIIVLVVIKTAEIVCDRRVGLISFTYTAYCN